MKLMEGAYPSHSGRKPEKKEEFSNIVNVKNFFQEAYEQPEHKPNRQLWEKKATSGLGELAVGNSNQVSSLDKSPFSNRGLGGQMVNSMSVSHLVAGQGGDGT